MMTNASDSRPVFDLAAAHAEKGERALVAMSGGVDSSVSALLLAECGLETEGVTMKLFDSEQASSLCGSSRDAEDARRICEKLGIPHTMCDFKHDFSNAVIERFCDEYLAGRTPNPCIDCNRHLKFSTLQNYREQRGFDYVATGHYVQREFDAGADRFLLRCGRDPGKDQSYVLFHITQNQLAHMLFPLGGLTKPHVRALAEAHGFINAHKEESQDICFIPNGDYAGFIQRRRAIEFAPGPIVNRDGDVLGTHEGLPRYTIGQRKGIGVAAAEPLYVYAKDAKANTLVVGTDADTLCSGIIIEDINLIPLDRLEAPRRLTVKTHYRQTAREAWAEQVDDNRIEIRFANPQRACAPGQAAVLYDGDIVIGGGTITRSC